MPTLAAHWLMRFLRWVAFVACFFGFPLVLANLALQHALDGQWNAYAAQVARRMTRLHDRLEEPASDRCFFYRDLQKLVQSLETFGPDRKAMGERLQEFQRRLPGLFDFYLTDSAGELVFPEQLPPVLSRFAIRKLHTQLLRALKSGTSKPLNKERNLLTYFWGETPPYQDLLEMHVTGELPEISPIGRRSFFYFRFTEHFGLFAHVNLQAVPAYFPMRVLTRRATRLSPDRWFGVSAVGETVKMAGLSRSERDLVERGLIDFETSPRESFLTDRYLLVVRALDPSYRLWSLTRLPVKQRGDLLRHRCLLYSILAFLVLALFSFGIMVLAWPVRISIQSRLTGIMSFAIGLPLVVILIMGYDYLGKTEQNLINQAFLDLEESVRSLDEKFPQQFRHVHLKIKNLLKAHQKADGRLDLEPFLAELLKRQVEIGFYWPQVVDSAGEILYASTDASGRRRDDSLTYAVTSEILRRLNRSLGFPDDMKTSGRGATSIFLSEDRSFKVFMKQSMKRFNQFNRYFERIFLFEPVFGPTGKGEMLICFNFKPRDLFYLYLQQNLLARQRQVANSQMFAINPEFPAFDAPAGFGRQEWVGPFVQRVKARQVLLRERLVVNREPVLVAAAPSKSAEGYYLVQTIPVREVIRDLRQIRWNLGMFIGFSLLMTMAVGSILARHFLQPIQALSEGVLAIQASRFRHRIPAHDLDELGRLSMMFNQTMERLEELSLARTVQGSLFPQMSLEVGSWRIFGRCVTATELGGDYYDYFSLGDEYLVVVIGDVAGHGTAAALLMAMAKAGLTLEVRRDASPARVLAALNSLLVSPDKRRKMLTFFYAVITVATGEVRYGNAGHNRPMFIHQGAAPVELKSSGLPLGSRKSIEYKEEAFLMAPGDRLWLYTDGIPETPGPGQEPMGYDRMNHEFAAAGALQGESSVQRVFRACETFRGNNPQPDDMTIILVERTTIG